MTTNELTPQEIQRSLDSLFVLVADKDPETIMEFNVLRKYINHQQAVIDKQREALEYYASQNLEGSANVAEQALELPTFPLTDD